jgi:signal transduction histidine kinase
LKAIKTIFCIFCFTCLYIYASGENKNLYQNINSKGTTDYVSFFCEMSTNALSESPSKSLNYAKAAERFVAKGDYDQRGLVYLRQVEAYMQLGKYRLAIFSAEKALSFNKLKDKQLINRLHSLHGQACKEAGDYPKAFNSYKLALKSYLKDGDLANAAQVYQWIGSLLLRQNKFDLAGLFYVKAEKLWLQIHDSVSVASNCGVISLLLRQKGDYFAALNKIDEGKKWLGNRRDENFATLLHLQGSVLFLQHQNDNAILVLEDALKLRRKQSSLSDIASTLLNLGNVYREKGVGNKGINYLHQALYIRLRLADTSQIVNTYNALGSYYLRFHDYDKALLNYIQALKCSYQAGFSNGIASLLMNVGTLYYELNDTSHAFEYLNRAVPLMRAENKASLALLYVHLGNNARKAGQYAKAIGYYQKSLNEKQNINDKAGISSVMLNMGAAYQEWKHYSQAVVYTNKALDLQRSFKNADESPALNQLGNIYFDQKNLQMAESYYRRGRMTAQKSGNWFLDALCARKEAECLLLQHKKDKILPLIIYSLNVGHQLANSEIIRKAQLALHDYYMSIGNFREALNAFRIYSALTDSINQKLNQRQIMQMQMNFEISRRDSKIKEADSKIRELNGNQLRHKQELHQQKIVRNFLIVIVLISILSAVLLIYGYRMKRKAAGLIQEKFDLSEETNKKLRESEEELRYLNQTKDKFFSIIAHDLKNPLGGLVSLTELMNQNYEQLDEQERREISILMNDSARQLNTLLENLLHWSRVQLGKMPYKPEYIKIKGVVEECFLLQKLNATNKKIKLQNTVEENVSVWADADMLSLILRNLISNAIKFTPENGSVTLSAVKKEQEYQIYVADTGIGLTDEEKDKLFRLDVRFSTAGTNDEPGTGLGLLLCKECVEKQGGTIWVESVPNRGSRFIFTLKTKNDGC